MKDINKLWILCTLVLLASCKVHLATKDKGLECLEPEPLLTPVDFAYPTLGFLLDGYQRTYFQDPENVDDMLRYFRFDRTAKDSFHKRTVKEYIRDQGDMSVRTKDGYVELLHGDSVRCSMPVYSFEPASASVMTIPSYIRGVHAYGMDRNPVKEEVHQTIYRDLKKLRMNYNKVSYIFLNEKYGKGYAIVEYTVKNDTFVVRNEGNYGYLLEDPYFKEVLDCLKSACKKFNLSRIMYTTALYYNE